MRALFFLRMSKEEDMYQANIDSDFSKVKIAEEEKPENRKN